MIRASRPSVLMETANFYFEHARGPIYGWFSEIGLRQLVLAPIDETPIKPRLLHSWVNDGRARQLRDQLDRYFAGQQETFKSITLDLSGGTPFQQAVWLESIKTPWGVETTYGDLANALGKPAGSARAVGAALGANPVAILVPCHRFRAANGDLRGYAAGLEWKRELLRLEGATLV